MFYLQGRRADGSGNPVLVKLLSFTLRLEYKVRGMHAVGFKQKVQRESLHLKADAYWIVNEATIDNVCVGIIPLGACG